MRRLAAGILVTIALLTAAPIAQEQERLFKAAMNTELVDGDLRAAIEQYRRVAAGGNRAVAAQALVRMAECYQKLGDVESRRTYERIVREFADQRDEVTLARARLAGGGSAAAPVRGDRAVWTGPTVDLFGTVSPDGRYLTYTDWGTTNNLMLRDLEAGSDRPLTNNRTYGEFGYVDWSAISRDGQQVAYGWTPRDTDRHELRVTSLHARGALVSRRIVQSQGRDSIRPLDWSPDGRWIAVLVEREDRSAQLGLIDVRDGTLRVLKTVDWRGIGKAVFSVDGLFIAYDLSVGEMVGRSHVFVMAVDGSREAAVVADASSNHIMAWAPDGHLVFASNRSGANALWSVAVESGRAAAPPTLVKENLGSPWSLGLTSSGTLYVWKYAGARYVGVTPFRVVDVGKAQNSSPTFQTFIESRGRPHFSADGKHLLYISCGPLGGGPCSLAIRSMETGVVREVPHRLGYMGFPRLASDGGAVITNGRDLQGRGGIYLIDTRTGDTSLVVADGTSPDWAVDGKSIYFNQARDRQRVLVNREIGSGNETDVFQTSLAGARSLQISPDRRFVAFVATDPGSRAQTLMLAPLGGAEARTLLHATVPLSVFRPELQWTSDSRALLVRKAAPDGDGTEAWFVPVTGQARKLELDTRKWVEGGHLQLHPDGQQIAFFATVGEPGAEVWALENFLPTLRGKK